MQELINNIANSTGISTDKASEVLLTVSGFIKEKYPLLAGTVDSVLKISTDKNDEENE
jgi:hypothetical protein